MNHFEDSIVHEEPGQREDIHSLMGDPWSRGCTQICQDRRTVSLAVSAILFSLLYLIMIVLMKSYPDHQTVFLLLSFLMGTLGVGSCFGIVTLMRANKSGLFAE